MAFVNNATVSSFQIYQIIACNKHSNINVEALFPLPEILAKKTELLFKLNIIWILTTPTCFKAKKSNNNYQKQTNKTCRHSKIHFFKDMFFLQQPQDKKPISISS